MKATPCATTHWMGRRHLFRVGTFTVASYSVLLYVGIVIGITVGTHIASTMGMEPRRFATAALVLLVPALVGARLWYVVERPRLFLAEPSRVGRTHEGGAGLYGGLVLSFAVSVPVLMQLALDFWTFWDAAGIAMLVGMMIARFGCLMNGCCHGRETDGPLGFFLPNRAGQWRRRFPTQVMESALSAMILGGALIARPHLPVPGTLFLSGAVAYGVGRLGLQQLRADAVVNGPSTRLNRLFSVVLVVVAGGTLIARG